MADERELNLRLTEDATQAIAAQAEYEAQLNHLLPALAANSAAEKELTVTKQVAREVIWGEQAATVEEAAAKGLATGASRELSNAENVLTFTRGRAIRAAIDEIAAMLGLKDVLAELAPVIVGGVVGGIALNAVLDAMKSRGVETSTVMDGVRGILDKLSVSFGGVGLAGEKFNATLTESGMKLAGAGDAAGIYATIQERLAAASVNAAKAQNDLAASYIKSSGGADLAFTAVTGFEAGLDQSVVADEKAASALADLNAGLNKIAAFDPELVARIAEYIKRMGESGGLTADRIQMLTEKIAADRAALEVWAASMAKMGPVGDEIVKMTEAWIKDYDTLQVKTEALRAANVSEADILEQTATLTRKVSVEAANLRGVISQLPPDIQVLILRWQAHHTAASIVQDDLDKIAKKHEEEAKALQKTTDEVNKATQSLKDHQLALSADIEKINAHAAVQIQKVQQAAQVETKSINDEISDLDRRRSEHTISDAEFLSDETKLLNDKNKINADSAAAIEQIDKTATDEKQKAKDKYIEFATQMETKILEVQVVEDKGGETAKGYAQITADMAVAVGESGRQHGVAAPMIKAVLDDVRTGKNDVKEIATHHHNAGVGAQEHATGAAATAKAYGVLNPLLPTAATGLGSVAANSSSAAIHFGSLHENIQTFNDVAPQAITNLDGIATSMGKVNEKGITTQQIMDALAAGKAFTATPSAPAASGGGAGGGF